MIIYIFIGVGLLVLFFVLCSPRSSNDVKYKKLEQTKERLVSVPAELKAELLVMLNTEQKIDAIKLYREKTGVGLVEAKDLVESLQKEIGK